MKILLISDKPSPVLYDYYDPASFRHVDLVISCGDLNADYLDFVMSMLNVPCYYVPGNHDTSFVSDPPAGWEPLDGRVISHEGIVMVGFGGSMRYRCGPYQYTEAEMTWRYLKMKQKIWRKKGKIDILVTHAPAFQLNDLNDRAHRGFRIFRKIIDVYRPKYFLHGHVHLDYAGKPRRTRHGETVVINGFGYYLFDY